MQISRHPVFDTMAAASLTCKFSLVALPLKKTSPGTPNLGKNIPSSHAPSRSPTTIGLVDSGHDLATPSQFHSLFCAFAHLQCTHAQQNINLPDASVPALLLTFSSRRSLGAQKLCLQPTAPLCLANASTMCVVVHFRVFPLPAQ